MIVLFWPETGSTRVFTSYNLAQEWYPGCAPATRPEQLTNPKNDAYTVYAKMYNRIGHKAKEPHPLPGEVLEFQVPDVLDHVWQLAMDAGDRVTRAPYATAPIQELRKGFAINLKAIPAFLETKEPKQARALALLFKNEQYDFYSSAEMRSLMITQRAYTTIKTKQDAWRIFRYYRPTLIAHGVVVDTSGEK